jgi:nicotinamidase/pyrazinamidase
MTKVLAVIDMQKDFIDGSLGTAEAVKTVPEVVKAIEDPSYDAVYATMDTHPENYLDTFEGKHLPVKHCIKGSEGWQLNPQVKAALEKRNAKVIEKPTFGSSDLVDRIAAKEPDEIVLVGLCTDICVISNALMLRAALYDTKISVIEKACAGVTPEKHAAAIEVMKSCQIDIL